MDDNDEFYPEHIVELLKEVASKLGEHFEAFQILGCYQSDEDDTCCVSHGRGNWYARVGMAQKFVETDNGPIDVYVAGTYEEDEE